MAVRSRVAKARWWKPIATRSRLAVAGATTVCLLGCAKGNHTPPPSTAAPSRAAADAFLTAWRRSLETSWSVEESLERATANGRHLTFALHRAQRPPDRLSVGLGSVDARRGNQLVTCAPDSGGQVHCVTGGVAPPYDKDVEGQLITLRPYVEGPQAVYVVAEVAGCFQLTLRLPGYPVPPYGSSAVFCFDPGTGAPAGSVIVRNEGTDRTRIVAAHSPASDADLAVPDTKQLQQGVAKP